MPKKILELTVPRQGINKKASHKQKPPYYTPDCLNVRPDNTLQGRENIGSRPGLGKYFFEQLGSGNPVNMLEEVDYIKQNDKVLYADYFEDETISSEWSIPSWLTYAPTILPDSGMLSNEYGEAGLVHSAYTPFDANAAYYIELLILPYYMEHWGKYRIYFNLDNTTPAIGTAGVCCELELTGTTGTYTGSLTEVQAGIGTATAFTAGTNGSALPGTLAILKSGTSAKVYWRGVLILDHTLTGTYAGSRVGFSMYGTETDSVCIIDGFRFSYSTGTYRQNDRKFLVAASNGILYSNYTYVPKLEAVTSNLTIAADRQILGTERGQKLYIADYGDVKTRQIDGVISGTSLDSASVSDWTTLGIDTDDDKVVILSATGATVAGAYDISTIASGNLTLSSSPGDGTAATFYIQRCPKIYDPASNTLVKWTATTGKGSVPVGYPNIITYRDRMVFAGDTAWFMSRQGDPLDWDTSQTDAKSAISGTVSDAGQLGGRLKALVKFNDDYILFLCDTSVWRLRGDPLYGGQLDSVSNVIGCVDKRAYCTTPEGSCYWLSYEGLYLLSSVTGSLPDNVSEGKLPSDLKNIDSKLYTVNLCYDLSDRGIHIYLTPKGTFKSKHYWFDIADKSFWPVEIPSTLQPYTTLAYTSQDVGKSCVLLGCKDGYIRNYDDAYEIDDGTEFNSHIVYGPMMNWDDYKEGRVEELSCELSRDSGEVKFELLKGNSAQNLVDNPTIFMSGTWSLFGTSNKTRPKMKSIYWGVKLSNNENRRWSLESIKAVTEQSGQMKV